MTWRKVLRVIRRESRKIPISHRVVDQLSPHHDSQILAFSTEVFDRMNQKHNRSSYPFTTLADRAERKVASTWAGQPNYWPKTWFGADAYKAKLATPKYAIKLFGLVGNSFYSHPEPLASYVGVRVWNNQRSKIQFFREKWILSTDYVYWNLSDMPIIILQIITPQPRLFDMLGVDGWGKRHFTSSE